MSRSWRLNHFLFPPFNPIIIIMDDNYENCVDNDYGLQWFIKCNIQLKSTHFPFLWLNSVLMLAIRSASFSKFASPSFALSARTFEEKSFADHDFLPICRNKFGGLRPYV